MPPKKPTTDIGEFAAIRSGTAAEISKVVLEYTRYIKSMEELQKIDGINRRLKVRELRDLRSLTKQMIEANKAQNAYTKGASALVSKLEGRGGVTGALTKLTGTLAKSFSSVDKGTGLMRMFGQQTMITAGSFAGYVAAAQLAAGAVVSFLEAQDKARIKQAKLMREFGAVNGLSISAPWKVASIGLAEAGKEGEKSAERLLNAIVSMRDIDGKFTLNPETDEGKGQFRTMTAMTAGILPNLPEYLTKLRTVFAKKPGEGMVEELKNIAAVAYESNVPIEQLVSQIFSLGEEFARVGGTTENATLLMSKYADAIGNAELPMQMVIDFARITQTQLRTSGGMEGMLMSTHFIANAFGDLPKEFQDTLNQTAKDMNEGKTFGQLDILAQADVFQELRKGGNDTIYAEASQKVIYDILKDLESVLGTQAVIGIAPSLTGGQDWIAFEKVYEASQKIDKTKGAYAVGEAIEGGDKLTIEIATAQMEIFALATATSMKEWTSDFESAIQTSIGNLIDFGAVVRGITLESNYAKANATIYGKIFPSILKSLGMTSISTIDDYKKISDAVGPDILKALPYMLQGQPKQVNLDAPIYGGTSMALPLFNTPDYITLQSTSGKSIRINVNAEWIEELTTKATQVQQTGDMSQQRANMRGET